MLPLGLQKAKSKKIKKSSVLKRFAGPSFAMKILRFLEV